MTSSQRMGLVIVTVVAICAAAVFGGGLVFVWIDRLGKKLFEVETLVSLLAVSQVFLGAWFIVRSFRRGLARGRWILFSVFALSAGFYLFLAQTVAVPFKDPEVEAAWQRDFPWIVPVTYAWSAICFLGAGLLLFPQVGAYLAYRRSRSESHITSLDVGAAASPKST